MLRCAVLLWWLPASTVAHGRMTLPVNRVGGSLDVAGTSCKGGPHGWNMCGYFTQNSTHPGPPTLCDTDLITTEIRHTVHGGCDTPDQYKNRISAPWRAPGSAPVYSPCGMSPNGWPGDSGCCGGECGHCCGACCGTTGCIDGLTLPPTDRTLWRRGTNVEVAFTITVNHGGGYIWRLCPAAAEQTEACFQRNSLEFADNVTTVHFVNGSEISIPAFRTTTGTTPAGSQWSMNPIPISTAVFPAPCPGCVGFDISEFDVYFSLIDRVVLPKDLPTGDYTLSWRWDNEQQPQVWTNCADVRIE